MHGLCSSGVPWCGFRDWAETANLTPPERCSCVRSSRHLGRSRSLGLEQRCSHLSQPWPPPLGRLTVVSMCPGLRISCGLVPIQSWCQSRFWSRSRWRRSTQGKCPQERTGFHSCARQPWVWHLTLTGQLSGTLAVVVHWLPKGSFCIEHLPLVVSAP